MVDDYGKSFQPLSAVKQFPVEKLPHRTKDARCATGSIESLIFSILVCTETPGIQRPERTVLLPAVRPTS